MKPLNYLFTSALSLMSLWAGTVGMAQATDHTDRSTTIEKSHHAYVIEADGSYVVEGELVMRINEERAIQHQAQHSLSYSQSLETLNVVEAFTLKPDGRQVQVNPQQIKEQQEPVSTQAPMFQDHRMKVVIFPEVAVGDRLVLRYQRHRTTALFPGHFEELFLPDSYEVEQLSLSYELPEDKPLQADSKGFTGTTLPAQTGRKRYRWDYVARQWPRIESSAVAYVDHGPYLAVSTFASYKDFARAYAQRAEVTVTPAITALANELTAHLDTPRRKALALSEWVRKNIRYVAVHVGQGGVVPHPAQAVLDNLYGDCKDHVALLEALLRAVAIESSPALINQGNAYALPSVPTLGLLNHVITYIPSLNLYLDSTAAPIAAGFLPITNLDKPILLTQSGEMARSPATQDNQSKSHLSFKVQADGAAAFTLTSTVEGWGAELTRYMLSRVAPAARDHLVQSVLQQVGQTGTGTLHSDAADSDPRRFTLTLKGRADRLVHLPGPTGFPTLTSLGGGILATVQSFAAENQRTQDFTCLSSEAEEQARFELPKSVSILAVPNPVSIRNGAFHYSATYEREGNEVVIHRRFKFLNTKATCSPEDFEHMKPTIEKMTNDLKSQIIVQAS
ncbi:transglutaminase-like putative cysteine protease [Pseudomonas sp. JAI115]|uniref:DUF3857 domain-containing transglutaminase family protein n=1 Tax=Pseudomonas sp. JAI115 TaxID=2723061 RepID=UPI0016080635|nr:DUF3857 and transglutaminase domain-containing protein [Pseudomonas sp. JAI115]MBB6155168.1 transglutaminase-like putative cysteine protease [Pseudomonas sp. JAI115]